MKMIPVSFPLMTLSACALIFSSCDEKKEEPASSRDSSAPEAPAAPPEPAAPSEAFLKLEKQLKEADPERLRYVLGAMRPDGITHVEYFSLIKKYVPEDQQKQKIGSWFYKLAQQGLEPAKEAYAILETAEQRSAALNTMAMPMQKSDSVAYFKWLKSLGEEKFIADAVKRAVPGVGAMPKDSDLNAYLTRITEIEGLELNEKEWNRASSSLVYGLNKAGLIDQAFLETHLDRFPEMQHRSLYSGFIQGIPAAELIKTYHTLEIPEKMKSATNSMATMIVAKNSTLEEALAWAEQYPDKGKRGSARSRIFMEKGTAEDGKHALVVLKAIESKSTFRFISKYLKKRFATKNPELAAEIETAIQERGDQ